jgi:hypothetical protein
MSNLYKPHTGVVVLRPWPFGPPLRGRAPHHDAGMAGTPSTRGHRLRSTPSASAPAGGLASSPTPCSVL